MLELINQALHRPLGPGRSVHDEPIILQNDWGLRLDGELCWLRLNKAGKIEHLALCYAKALSLGDLSFSADPTGDLTELTFPP